MAAEPFTDQAGKVSRDAVDFHRAEVDDAGQSIVFEEEVVSAGVTKAGLEIEHELGSSIERIEDRRRGRTREREPFGRGRRFLGDGRLVCDGGLDRVKTPGDQLRHCVAPVTEAA